jgi:mono/diheme cytochrome c family protein
VKRAWLIGAAIGAASIALFCVWLGWPDLLEQPPAETFVSAAPALAERGEYLARAGNCIACHTAPGEEPYAGNRRIATPFGDVFSSNLTPDGATGIGTWSSADFWRALHYGKARDGRRLYPAFPFTSYTNVTRDDADAIFAFLRSLEPVAKPRAPHTVRFPYGTDLAQRVWRALYFRPGKAPEDAARSAEWRRGAYLVEGLGHCAQCHTPRTRLGGSRSSAPYGGGAIPAAGWDAPPLALPETLSDEEAAELVELLARGTSRHRVTTGPMAEVVLHSLQYLRRADLEAIVAYLRALPPRAAAASQRSGTPDGGPVLAAGKSLYEEHCAECHGADGRGEAYRYPALAGNGLVTAPGAANVLQTVLFGGFAPSTAAHPRPYGMPAYSEQLSSAEIAAVISYIRAAWGNNGSAVRATAVSRR